MNTERLFNQEVNRNNNWEENLRNIIKRLKQSSYKRISEGEVDTISNLEKGTQYKIKKMSLDDTSKLEEVFNLLKKYENQTGLKEDINGLKDLLKEEDIAIFYAEDEKGNVVSVNCAEVLSINNKEEKSEEAILVDYYISTEESFRLEKITEELLPNVFQFGLDRARKKGVNLKALVLEAADKRLSFLFDGQKEGRRGEEKMRPFYYDKEGNLCEVSYKIPDTGKVYHLMIYMLDGRDTISNEELVDILKTIVFSYYENKEEIEKNKSQWSMIIEEVIEIFKREEVEKINILSYKDIKEKKRELELKGKKVIEEESSWEKEKTLS